MALHYVTLKCRGRYAITNANPPQNRELQCRPEGVHTWSVYERFDEGAGTFKLRSNANGFMVGINPADSVVHAAPQFEAATFVSENTPDGFVNLRCLSNNKYLESRSSDGLLSVSRTTPDENCKFLMDQVVDMWLAATSFANLFRDRVKLAHGFTGQVAGWPGATLQSEFLFNDSELWTYSITPDTIKDPRGHPVWDRYGLEMINEWEVLSCFATLPHFNHGSYWNSIPRCARYLIPSGRRDSPVKLRATWKEVAMDCSIVDEFAADAFGRSYGSRLVDLANSESETDMGQRWVLDVGYADTTEIFTYDLGPALNVFQPLYGLVGYTNDLFPSAPFNDRIAPTEGQWIPPRRCHSVVSAGHIGVFGLGKFDLPEPPNVDGPTLGSSPTRRNPGYDGLQCR